MASRLLLRPRRLAPRLLCSATPRRGCHALFSTGGDALPSASPSPPRLPRWGWGWDDSLSVDENYLDLAFLLARNSRAPPQVGCVLVAGVDDGGARRRQGVELVCAANSFIASDTQRRGQHMLRKTDCHAEAHAIAECAGRGLAVRGAACYVNKPPCGNCFSLLAVAGVSTIISPRPMTPKLCGAAKARGIAMRWVAEADEEAAHARRRVVAEGQADMELVRALRLERRFTASQRQRANLGRTVDRSEVEGSEAPPQLLVERDDEWKST